MKPEQTFRIGSVTASVFLNSAKVGETTKQMRSVKMQRRYRDEQGEWQSASTYSLSELPQLQAVVSLAMNYVSELEATAPQG